MDIYKKGKSEGEFYPFINSLPAPGSNKVAYPIVPAMI